ncbi:MAG: endo alpha-1,4 polygalactosaminidase, partial [Chloroflexi bacterium]
MHVLRSLWFVGWVVLLLGACQLPMNVPSSSSPAVSASIAHTPRPDLP